MSPTGPIERHAVGRYGTIGSLYDIRTDKLEGTNLFNKEVPSALIKISDNASFILEYDSNTSQKETFNKLNIEGNLKLSLMSGMVGVGGSAKFLKQTKTDGRTVRFTCIYKLKTKQEHLQISMAELHQYFSPDALENPDATHVVTGIIWGANVAATFEQVVQNHEKVKEIEGKLSLILKGFPISGEAKLEYGNTKKSEFESLRMEFSGDLLINQCPRTVEEVMSVFEKIPDLIKPLNDGKGQQLVFVLYPLERMAQIFQHKSQIERLIQEVSDSLVIRIENIFDEIISGKRKLNDFLNELEPWKDYVSLDWQNTIQQKQSELNTAGLNTQRQLSTLLQNIRGGQVDELKTKELLDNFDLENLYSLMSIKQFLKDKRHVKFKIQRLGEFNRETNLLKELRSIKHKMWELYEKEVYLLHISHKWETEDIPNSSKQIRCFKNLIKIEEAQNDQKSDQKNSEIEFIVIDYDLHHSDLEHDEHRAEKCCIYYAKHGTIESKDYYEYLLTLKNLSQDQISSILKDNAKLSEQELLDWHKTFMDEHPRGELTKDGFVSELTKIYKSGNATKYCDYIFAATDKDKNGKIGFYEFMSAVALTSVGNDNVAKRLGLIFDAFNKNGKRGIRAGELVKFIEILTELVKGKETVDTPNAKSIVDQMFQQCGKNQENDELFKEEFVNCCTKNDQICLAFLPDISGEIQTKNTKFQQSAITVAGGNENGDEPNQLNYPEGIFIANDKSIYIADSLNNRIVKWKLNSNTGEIIAGGNGKGYQNNQLNDPRDIIFDQTNNSFIISDHGNKQVIRYFIQNQTDREIIIPETSCNGLTIDKDGSIYVSDCKKREVRQYKQGDGEDKTVAGGNHYGNQLNQLHYPTFIFIDDDYSLYISDTENHRVMKWKKDAKEGIVVAGRNGQGDSLKQLNSPSGVFVDRLGQIYIADFWNHRIVRWRERDAEGEIVVGGNGQGNKPNQLNGPTGVSFDNDGNLYVADSGNHRIQKYAKI